MDIERINENTLKFYISYIDIEKRGFTRDEIWFNREKSEELFWDMMDEISDESEFEVEGPLWIQVHALEKGLEVTVTRAHGKDDDRNNGNESSDIFYPSLEDNAISNKLDSIADLYAEVQVDSLESTFLLENFDDLISLAKRVELPSFIDSALFHYEGRYFLYVELLEEEDETAQRKFDNVVSIISEYALKSPITVHRLEEYGKEIIETNVFEHIRKYF